MIGKVEVQHDIAYFKLQETPIIFPNMRKSKTKIFDLPTDAQITETIAEAKKDALEDCEAIGMSCPNTTDIDEYDFQVSKHFSNMLGSDNENSDEETEEGDEWNDCCGSDDEDCDQIGNDEIKEELFSPYVFILDENGIERKVRKTTYQDAHRGI